MVLSKKMNNKVIAFNLAQRKDRVLDLKTGDVVRVHKKIKEGDKERIQIFEGMIIAIKGKQSSSPTITVRKVSNGVGVEMVFPIFSPHLEKIEQVKRAKTKRSKLYYIREKTAKALKLKYKDISEFAAKEEEVIDEKTNEVPAEEAPAKEEAKSEKEEVKEVELEKKEEKSVEEKTEKKKPVPVEAAASEEEKKSASAEVAVNKK